MLLEAEKIDDRASYELAVRLSEAEFKVGQHIF